MVCAVQPAALLPQCCQKSRQNLAQTHRCRAGCISACLLGDFSTLLIRICLVGRLSRSSLHTGVFGRDFAYFSGNALLFLRGEFLSQDGQDRRRQEGTYFPARLHLDVLTLMTFGKGPSDIVLTSFRQLTGRGSVESRGAARWPQPLSLYKSLHFSRTCSTRWQQSQGGKAGQGRAGQGKLPDPCRGLPSPEACPHPTRSLTACCQQPPPRQPRRASPRLPAW